MAVHSRPFWFTGNKKAPHTDAGKLKTISMAIVTWGVFHFNRRHVPIYAKFLTVSVAGLRGIQYNIRE